MNHSHIYWKIYFRPEPVSIPLQASYTSALNGTMQGPRLELGPYDIEILEIQ
jgi:beta-galactosidase